MSVHIVEMTSVRTVAVAKQMTATVEPTPYFPPSNYPLQIIALLPAEDTSCGLVNSGIIELVEDIRQRKRVS